jgi:hypothetical protein
VIDPVTEQKQKEVDATFERFSKRLKIIYFNHTNAQADYFYYKSLLDNSVLKDKDEKNKAIEKMKTSYALFKKRDIDFRETKEQIEYWTKACRDLQKTMPNLKCYNFDDVFKTIF